MAKRQAKPEFDMEVYNQPWNTKEDFERDLILFADFEPPDDRKPKAPTPDTIRRFKETMRNNRRSIYTDCEVDESLTYFISGRGKGEIDRFVRPGEAVTPLPSDDEELKRQIRRVSGLGSSNALIEQSIKSHYADQKPSTNEIDWSVWESAGTVQSFAAKQASERDNRKRTSGAKPEASATSSKTPVELQPESLTAQGNKTVMKDFKQ